MPYDLFKKLGMGEPKLTGMSIQLADRFVKYCKGMIDVVLVHVESFIIPVHFVVMGMIENVELILILGCPFLATTRATTDVWEGKFDLEIRR